MSETNARLTRTSSARDGDRRLYSKSQRLPNLVIAGVSRAGTTSLFRYLAQHPDVGTSDVKELRYFSAVRHGQPLGSLDLYAAHFKTCTQAFAVEATPGYFYGGGPLATVLKETCPSVRVLVSLRSPIDRCWSWFRFVKSRDRIPRDMPFTAYLDRCQQLRDEGIDGTLDHQPFWGMGGGCYSVWLDKWTAAFGDRFRVLLFDDLVNNPHASLKSVCEWLGLDQTVVDEFDFALTNKSELYKNRLLQKGAVSLNRHSESFFQRHPAVKRTLRSAYYSVNKAPAHPGMFASERSRLDEFYRPYNERLAKQLSALGLAVPDAWAAPPQ
jgi:hypothetical protein